MQPSEKALVYTHRKGVASTVVCQDCGFLIKDPQTGQPYRLTEQKGERWFEAAANKKIKAFDECPHCGGNRLKPLGATSNKLAQVLGQHFRDTHEVVVIDGDTVKTKTNQKNFQKIVDTASKPLLIVGTRKVFSAISCLYSFAVIANIGGLLAARRYDMLTRACWQLAHCAIRTDGAVFVQAKKSEHPLIEHIQNQTIQLAVEKDHRIRARAMLSPWYRMLFFTGKARHKAQHEHIVRTITAIVDQTGVLNIIEQHRDSLEIKGIWHTEPERSISSTERKLRSFLYEYDFEVKINPLSLD